MTKIFLDAGHGGKDPGAVAGGKREKDFTLDIDNRINDLLKARGFKIERTRTGDIFVDSTPRANKVKNSGAKYCISSHINAGGGTGAEVLVSQHNDKKLAREILKNLSELGLENRGVKTRKLKNGKDYYFMHRLTGSVTTLIVEYCFIDTKEDRDFISKSSNRQKCAEAVVNAICKIEGIDSKPSNPPKSKPTPKSTIKPTQNKIWRNYISGPIVKQLQRELNIQFSAGLVVDGWFGNKVINALVNVRKGARGNLTRIIQQRLQARKYDIGRYGADGIFGNATDKAVRRFQNNNKLTVDGIVGKNTWKALFRK